LNQTGGPEYVVFFEKRGPKGRQWLGPAVRPGWATNMNASAEGAAQIGSCFVPALRASIPFANHSPSLRSGLFTAGASRLISVATSESGFKTLESIATPCSVNAMGKNPPRLDREGITFCDSRIPICSKRWILMPYI
jgi:hypothetical protein